MESAAVFYAANDVTQVCRDQTREEVATIMPGRPRKRRVSKPRVVERRNAALAAWSPTIRIAFMAGTPWLDLYCPGSWTNRAIDIRTINRHPRVSSGLVRNKPAVAISLMSVPQAEAPQGAPDATHVSHLTPVPKPPSVQAGLSRARAQGKLLGPPPA
jgi:hypothetical protein